MMSLHCGRANREAGPADPQARCVTSHVTRKLIHDERRHEQWETEKERREEEGSSEGRIANRRRGYEENQGEMRYKATTTMMMTMTVMVMIVMIGLASVPWRMKFFSC